MSKYKSQFILEPSPFSIGQLFGKIQNISDYNHQIKQPYFSFIVCMTDSTSLLTNIWIYSVIWLKSHMVIYLFGKTIKDR